MSDADSVQQPSERLQQFIAAARTAEGGKPEAVGGVIHTALAGHSQTRLKPLHVVALTLLMLLAFGAGVFTTLLMVREPARAPLVLTRADAAVPVTFVLVAAGAREVALVGDFNDWNPAHTHMQRRRDGVWTAVLELSAGRYNYAFLVDGTRWEVDPDAPASADEDFGRPNSVLLVRKRT